MFDKKKIVDSCYFQAQVCISRISGELRSPVAAAYLPKTIIYLSIFRVGREHRMGPCLHEMHLETTYQRGGDESAAVSTIYLPTHDIYVRVPVLRTSSHTRTYTDTLEVVKLFRKKSVSVANN